MNKEQRFLEAQKLYQKQIADLESKLAESEKTEDGAFWFEMWQHKKRDYDSVYKAYIENCAEVDQLKQQLAETDKLMQEYLSKCLSLEQQLAEKDQAIEGLQEINQSLGQTCNNDAKEIERLREKLAKTTVFAPKISNNAELVLQIIEYDKAGIDYLKQSQNQTAIAELTRVKEWVEPKYFDKEQINYLANIIDQQINNLRRK